MRSKTIYKITAVTCLIIGVLTIGFTIQNEGFLPTALVIGIIFSAYKMGLWREDRYKNTTHSLTEY